MFNSPSTATAGAPPGKITFPSALALSAWFGVAAGLIESVGLLAFQHINWERWGPMIHVSKEILWISPIVDVLFFSAIAILIALLGCAIKPLSGLRTLVFALGFLTVYDWLALTSRLDRRACVILAVGVAFAFSRWAITKPSAWRFCKRTIPWMLLLWVLILFGIEGGQWLQERNAIASLPAAASGSPNVLLIIIDTLRADHVSSAGYSRATTPNLDALSREGVQFTNAIAPCSWSLPSHVSLMTGRYLYEHGVGKVQPEPWLGWGSRGMGGFATLSEALEKKGYRTGAFSANRTYFSRDLGFGRGFIHFEDYFHSSADMFVRTFYGREFARIYLIRSDKSLVKRALRAIGASSLLDQDAEGSGSYGGAFGIRKRANVVNDEILAWINQGQERPFFVTLNYFDVHDPYGGPPSEPKPAWEQNTDIDRYDDGVHYVDDYMGRLLRELDRRGLAKNTLVIVTSDHGESLGQHYLETHGRALYRELIQVPLVIWKPGTIPAGIRINQPVSNSAIPATVMDVIGEPGQGSFPGPSLSGSWKTPSQFVAPNPLSELAQNRYPGKKDQAADQLIPTASSGAMASVVTPQWQLIVHDKMGWQIFDWKHDPSEGRDLAQTADGAASGQSLQLQLEAQRNRKR
jgi:arylsulfatase A-like enzyme